MSKLSVKRPFTVLVGVILVLVLGFVSFTSMTTDLLPTMSLPYMLVITTYPGASPEMVEMNVTEPLEGSLGTISGVENVSSTSSENYSMVILEFSENTNMDSAMVKVASALDMLTLPDLAGSPMVIEMSPDMLATMMVTVDYEDMDIYELTEFVDNDVVPELKRQDGVADVTTSGMVEQYVEVQLNQDKIDEVNGKLLEKVTKTLDDSAKELADAREELEDAKEQLESSKSELESTQGSTASQLAQFTKLMNQALATQTAYQANLAVQQANQAALQAEQEGYQSAWDQIDEMIQQAYEQAQSTMNDMTPAEIQATVINQLLESMDAESREQLGLPDSVSDSDLNFLNQVWDQMYENDTLAGAMDLAKEALTANMNPLPKDLDDALANNGEKLQALQDMLLSSGDESAAAAAAQLDYATLQGMKDRLDAIKIELSNLNTQVAVAQAALESVNKAVEQAIENYENVEAGKITAAASFGSFSAQMFSGEAQIESGLQQLDTAEEQLAEARETALKNANLDQMLTMETLSAILTAENFDMPAGYIKDGDTQYLLKVGEKFDTVDALEGAILTRIEDIGDIHLSDVADIVVLDNSGDSYTKVNGNDAIMISITKSSTAGTSTVAERCNDAMDAMEEKYPGLHFTSMMDQGEYIGVIINSVLSNLIWGSLLAFLVLLIFLRDLIPTLVVAISIPLSVLLAIVMMYFSNMTMNIISLSGLALGVGMLVDNSVVVMENIYRMRGLGVPPARAAVKGARQVSGAILASTLTTICVFLPLVFTDGLARQLFTDMGLTIGFSLGASVIVALTVVPALSATLLRNSKEKSHKFFDGILNLYDQALTFCLRVKLIPLGIALGLLIFSGIMVTRMPMTMIPGMGGTQMSMTMTSPEDCSTEDAYAKAEDFMEMAMALDGMETVGVMDGSATSSAILGGSMGGGSNSTSTTFTVYMIVSDDRANDTRPIKEAVEGYFDGSDWEYTLSTSNMDLSALTGSGLQLNVEGKDLDTLLEISEDMKDLLGQVEGFGEITNGQEEGDATYKIVVNKDRAMRKNLTVAQIYQFISGKLTTDTQSTTLEVGDQEYVVHIVDSRDPISLENVLEQEIETTKTNDSGEQETVSYPLKDFCELVEVSSVASISRENQVRYISVSAETLDGYNTTLLSREVETLLEDYETPDGYRIEIAGESESVNSTMRDMLKMIALACIFIYLIMVAQFQSLLSPFIVIFTIPLAFTGGLLALLLSGDEMSMIAMMGFLVLSGVVVNNGIVFVDYTNQLRLAGMERREALVTAGKTRMRPILMTALTTILAMSTMAFDTSWAGSMGKGMALVTIGGLIYATFMTLFIVPVLYDLMFRKQIKEVDLGELESLDDMDVL